MPDVSLLAAFNAAAAAEAERDLAACCAARRWVAEMVAGRPYADLDALLAASRTIMVDLDWAEVREALDAHPRIGDRAEGNGREAAWSRGEQSAARTDDERLADDLRAANLAYEQRFGHVFLICATGRSAGDVLSAARSRVTHDEDRERQVVRAELGRIVDLRLGKLVHT